MHQEAAHTLSLEVVTFEIRRPEDIALAFGALKGRADAIHVVSDALINTYWTRIIALALSARLPTISTYRENVKAGGTRFLRGTKPSDILVEQPTTFDLVINVTTAKTLGLTIPATLLAAATPLKTRSARAYCLNSKKCRPSAPGLREQCPI